MAFPANMPFKMRVAAFCEQEEKEGNHYETAVAKSFEAENYGCQTEPFPQNGSGSDLPLYVFNRAGRPDYVAEVTSKYENRAKASSVTKKRTFELTAGKERNTTVGYSCEAKSTSSCRTKAINLENLQALLNL